MPDLENRLEVTLQHSMIRILRELDPSPDFKFGPRVELKGYLHSLDVDSRTSKEVTTPFTRAQVLIMIQKMTEMSLSELDNPEASDLCKKYQIIITRLAKALPSK